MQQYNEELERIVKERTYELSDALESERQINEMKSAFITIASHELRTPVTIILSSAILIEKFKNLGLYDKIDAHIGRIKLSIKNFTTILEDFLSLEKLERGVVRVKKESFDVQKLVESITEEMGSILKPPQQIKYVHKGRKEVQQDKKILRNILLNLLTNAIKYSDTDVELQTRVEQGRLRVKVKDQGIGIPIEEQQHLFKRFFRARNVEHIQGTGLGLSIVARYLELLAGAIEFTSIPGKGTTFWISLKESE